MITKVCKRRHFFMAAFSALSVDTGWWWLTSWSDLPWPRRGVQGPWAGFQGRTSHSTGPANIGFDKLLQLVHNSPACRLLVGWCVCLPVSHYLQNVGKFHFHRSICFLIDSQACRYVHIYLKLKRNNYLWISKPNTQQRTTWDNRYCTSVNRD